MPTSCTGPTPAVLELEQHAEAVHRARRFVHEHCRAAGIHGDLCDTAVLLTSEVVTNAFLHGGSGARLTVTTTTGRVHVEVGDASTALPHRTPADPYSVGGRGLAIVDALASDWGARRSDDGKWVWFELVRQA